MFVIPSGDKDDPAVAALGRTRSNLPWGVILLFGGGLSLANAFVATGLAEWIGHGTAGDQHAAARG